MSKVWIIGGFVMALAGVGMLAGNARPIVYGLGSGSVPAIGMGLTGTILAIGGSITSLLQMFKGGGTLKAAEGILGKFIGTQQTPENIAVEVSLVTLFTVCAKNGDIANLAVVSGLASSMLTKKV